MSEKKSVSTPEIPLTGLRTLITYDNFVKFLDEMIVGSNSYSCPVCSSLDKYIHTYTDSEPHYASIYDNLIAENFNVPDPKLLFTVAVQCRKCGRLDSFNAATLFEWVNSKQGVNNATS